MKYSQIKSMSLKRVIALANGADEDRGSVVLTPAEKAELDAMTPTQLLQLWTQWHLGSSEWADEFIKVWDQINGESVPEPAGHLVLQDGETRVEIPYTVWPMS